MPKKRSRTSGRSVVQRSSRRVAAERGRKTPAHLSKPQTMEIKERRDGGCDFTMSLAGLDEVKRWVMRFGAEAEALQPESLRDSIAAELREMRRLYA